MKDPFKTLGLKSGASEREIKLAYRKLALKYHPDRNSDPGARERFEEINQAYEFLLEQGGEPTDRADSYDDAVAREVLRREREKRRQQARTRQKQKEAQEAFLQRPEWHDPILLGKYLIHLLAIVMAIAGVLVPIAYAILVTYESLAGTFFFILAGGVLCTYIYQRRKTWLKLGKLLTTWKDVRAFLSMKDRREGKEDCCYARGQKANGHSYRVELVKTLDVKMRNYGVLNHKVKYKNRVRKVQIPRSARAMVFHRMGSILKGLSILLAILLLPLESFSWRFLAGVLTGGVLSWAVLILARVKPKTTYLFTPYLLLKAAIWILVLILISDFGPGFEIRTYESIFFFLASLLFFLDMVLDLLLSFFPFYNALFRPLVKQGRVMDALYREDYRNYQELPVYSVFLPFFRWLF